MLQQLPHFKVIRIGPNPPRPPPPHLFMPDVDAAAFPGILPQAAHCRFKLKVIMIMGVLSVLNRTILHVDCLS